MTIKPGGIYASHPSTRLEVGDLVSCDWNGNDRVTVHRIIEKRTGERGCQTGTVFQVIPPLRSSQGRPLNGAWIDAAWFWVDGLEVL